jgi:hypothetical protein
MINDKLIFGLDNELKRRLSIVNTELEYLNRESKKKYALNNSDELSKIKKDYDLYSKEFDLLSQLSDFYSANI